MTKGRFYYAMDSRRFNQITTTEGQPPRCEHCNKILKPSKNPKDKVLTKQHSHSASNSKSPKRYCEECRKKLKIWIN